MIAEPAARAATAQLMILWVVFMGLSSVFGGSVGLSCGGSRGAVVLWS